MQRAVALKGTDDKIVGATQLPGDSEAVEVLVVGTDAPLLHLSPSFSDAVGEREFHGGAEVLMAL